jgi:hypothetical protein
VRWKRRACARPTWLSCIATTPALTHRFHPCSCAPFSPMLTRWLCPCSRTHPSSSALMQPPPMLADGKRRTSAVPLRVSHLCSLPRSGCRPCSFLCVWLLLADGKRWTPAAPLRVSHLCSLPRSGCRPCLFLCVWLLLAAPGPYSR